MGWDAPWHWVVLAIIVIALFGYKKLPDAARSMGRSLRIFKTEIKGMSEDDKARAAAREEAEAPRALPASEPVAPVTPPVPPAAAPLQAPAPEPATTPSSSSTAPHGQGDERR